MTALNLEQLPEDIKTAISSAQAKLESGELQEAKDALGQVKSILKDAARFDATSPVDLNFERLMLNKSNIFMKEAPPFKQCQIVCLPQGKAGSMEQIGYHELHKLRQATKTCRETLFAPVQVAGVELRPSPFALLLEISAQNVPLPMYVSAEMYKEAAEIIKLNLELCAFLFIVPVLAEQSPA